MKIKWKHVGIKLALLLVVICASLSNGGIDTMDRFQVSSEPVVVKAATKKQNQKKKKVAAYNKKARKAYRKFLKEYYVEGKSFYYYGQEYKWSDYRSKDRLYAIKDLNHDGKVELIIYNYGRPEYYLFTYHKNKVKCISSPGYHHTLYECKKGNVIINSEANGGFESCYLLVLKNGGLNYVGGFYLNSKEAGGGILVNGKFIEEWEFRAKTGEKISRSKFKKILKKYTGSTDIKAFAACYMSHKNVKTQLKDIKYKKYKMPTVKPVTGIKLEHQFSYEKSDYEDSYCVNDKCKITWSKSVKGNVQIVYSTDKNFKYKTTKTIKASSKKNSFAFKTYGDTYYVKLRAYIGDKIAKSKYSKVYTFKGKEYWNGLKKEDIFYYVFREDEKSYICERNLTTNEENIVLGADDYIRLWTIEGDYIYYCLDSYDWTTSEIYVYNLSKKEEKLMFETSDNWSLEEIISGKVICTIGNSEGEWEEVDLYTFDLYTFDLDGTNKKKILENVFTYFSYSNKIYWCEYEYDEDEEEYAFIWKSCDLDGENKTKITDWIYLDFDEVYLMYSKDYIIENYIENED